MHLRYFTALVCALCLSPASFAKEQNPNPSEVFETIFDSWTQNPTINKVECSKLKEKRATLVCEASLKQLNKKGDVLTRMEFVGLAKGMKNVKAPKRLQRPTHDKVALKDLEGKKLPMMSYDDFKKELSR